jgi:hypothetical protein
VFGNGFQVADLALSQNYDAVLWSGQHVVSISMNPKTDGQSRRNDASTQSPARLMHSPRFGEALSTLRLSNKRGCRRRWRFEPQDVRQLLRFTVREKTITVKFAA